MKNLLFIILLFIYLTSGVYAKNLYDIDNGVYIDLDSVHKKNNFGYMTMEVKAKEDSIYKKSNLIIEFDLKNNKYHLIKMYCYDSNDKIINIVETNELPNDSGEWKICPKDSVFEEMIKLIKKYL